jgi:putative restriction endonuclease
VTDITEDPSLPDHFYASIDSYLPFDHDVPFLDGGSYYEGKLVKEDGSTNKGAFGRAVRHLSDREYDRIVLAGFAHVLGEQPRLRPSPDPAEEPMRPVFGFGETAQADFSVPDEQDRTLITQLVSRPFRDKAFSTAIKTAYRDTCAMTGLKIINGGGRSEVQAAHIRPVADRGPDSVRNGLALSGTIHWMFDRGLLSVDDDYSLLLAKGRLPDVAERLLVPDRKLILPQRQELRPHPKFLNYHRDVVFKG